jgi:hypothetical protein
MSRILASVFLAIGIAYVPRSADAAMCDSLRGMKLTNTVIRVAEAVGPGKFLAPGIRQDESVAAMYQGSTEIRRVESHHTAPVSVPPDGCLQRQRQY